MTDLGRGIIVGEMERPHARYSLIPAALAPLRNFLGTLRVPEIAEVR